MRRKRKNRLILKDPRQRTALASTVRMELLEHLHAAGPATVSQIASRMGRTPHSLYHHFRLLNEVALIRRVEVQRSGARDQAVYDVVADLFEISAESGDSAGEAAERKTVGVILRQAEREFGAALISDPEGMRSGDFYVGRARANLSRSAQKEVQRHLRAILKIFEEQFRTEHPPRTRVRNCSITAAFVPAPGGSKSSQTP